MPTTLQQLKAMVTFQSIDTTSWFFLSLLLAAGLFFGVMAALHRLSPRAKKWLTIVSTFIAGLYFTIEFFVPATRLVPETGEMQNFLTPTIEPVSNFLLYTLAWVFGLGIISLVMVHGQRLLRGKAGWHNSLAFFLAFLGVLVIGFWTDAGEKGSATAQTIYNSLYFGLLLNMDAAMFALLAFYIASAAYRAFRVRTVEAGLLMAAALIVMLGMVNFGVMLTSGIPIDSPWSFFRIERFSQWILNWVNGGAYRAVVIGVEIGALAMALRIWLSLERGAFFSQEG